MSLEYTSISKSADVRVSGENVVSVYCSGQADTDENKNISITIVNNELFQVNKKKCIQDIHTFIDSAFKESV